MLQCPNKLKTILTRHRLPPEHLDQYGHFLAEQTVMVQLLPGFTKKGIGKYVDDNRAFLEGKFPHMTRELICVSGQRGRT